MVNIRFIINSKAQAVHHSLSDTIITKVKYGKKVQAFILVDVDPELDLGDKIVSLVREQLIADINLPKKGLE